MTLGVDLKSEVLALSARSAWADAEGSETPDEMKVRQLAHVELLMRAGEDARFSLIAELREAGATWPMLAQAIDGNPESLARRFAAWKAGTSASQEAGRTDSEVSISEASKLTGVARATIHRKIAAADESAIWFKLVPTRGEKQREVYRILDLEEMKTAPTRSNIQDS